MNKAEITKELKQILQTLSIEELHEVLISAKLLQSNLFKDKPNAFNQFYDFIFSILRRPHMYGVEDVNDLSLIVMALCYASNGDIGNIAIDFNKRFRVYVNNTHTEDFKSRKTDYDWPRLIRLYSSGNKGSLELFERWFTVFIENYRKELSTNQIKI